MVDRIMARVVASSICCSGIFFGCDRDPAATDRSETGAEAGGRSAAGTLGGASSNRAGRAGSLPIGGAVAAGGASVATGGGAGSAGAAGSDNVADRGPECATKARGLLLLPVWDALGYAPYALSGCTLAYVAPDGALWLRDLASGEEELLDASDQTPRRPSLSRDAATWEVLVQGKSQVRVLHAGRISTLAGDFDHAGEPRAAPGTVAFTAWAKEGSSSDTDVFTYEVATGAAERRIGGSGQQRFPDISPDHLAASDFSEDPSGIFDEAGSLSDLVLLERSTGKLMRRPRPGKQAFPLLGRDGALAYLEWGAVHPEPKFSGFSLLLGQVGNTPEQDLLIRTIQTDPRYLRPSLSDEAIDFVDSSTGPATLYRARLAAPTQIVPAALDSGTPLGPVATPALTLIGARVGDSVELRVVAR